MDLRDLQVKRDLFQREDGSYYLFSEDQFNDHLYRAMGVIAAYNNLTKALAKFEDIAEKAKKKEYLLGIMNEGGDYIRNEYRKTLEKELKGISFFSARRAALIEESVEAIPGAIFESIDKYLDEARRAGRDLKQPVRAKDLTFTLSDDKSCLWVGLAKEYEEDLRASLVENVSEKRIQICERLVAAISELQKLAQEGAYLGGHGNPNGTVSPGIVETLVTLDQEGKCKPVSLGDIVSRLYIKSR